MNNGVDGLFSNLFKKKKVRYMYFEHDGVAYKKYVAKRMKASNKFTSVERVYSDRYPSIDIVAKNNGIVSCIKTCVCTAWNSYVDLSVRDIMDFVNASRHYKANLLYVYTNGKIKPDIIQFGWDYWIRFVECFGIRDAISQGQVIQTSFDNNDSNENNVIVRELLDSPVNNPIEINENPKYRKGDGEGYEHYVAYILKQYRGFEEAQVTQLSGDYGADIIAYKDGIKYCIQCKNYDGVVTPDAVREVYAALNYYNADIGMVVTNSTLTKEALELARINKIRVWEEFGKEDMISGSL